jgi:O-antigen ligase
MLAEEEGLDSRLVVFEFSINHIFSSLQIFFIGDGIGSFGLRHLNEDVRDYPHNLLLEVWFELGLVGLIAIALFLYKTGRNIFIGAGYLHLSIGCMLFLTHLSLRRWLMRVLCMLFSVGG